MNDKIKDAIVNNKAVSFGKIGSLEAAHILIYLNKIKVQIGFQLFSNVGIYVSNFKEFEDWCIGYLNAIKDLNYILQWCPNKEDESIIKNYWKGDGIYHSFEGIEPFVFGQDGWHYSLKNKKVLCISPFSETVKAQVEHFDKIWPGASIGKIITITSPYPEILTGENNLKPWRYKLNLMLDEIDKCEDFDFATIGCGGFSLFLCQYIKNVKKKPCVHLGGGNQILYGIRGKRWDEGFKNHTWYGTEYWVRPLDKEIPKNHQMIENGCYW